MDIQNAKNMSFHPSFYSTPLSHSHSHKPTPQLQQQAMSPMYYPAPAAAWNPFLSATSFFPPSMPMPMPMMYAAPAPVSAPPPPHTSQTRRSYPKRNGKGQTNTNKPTKSPEEVQQTNEQEEEEEEEEEEPNDPEKEKEEEEDTAETQEQRWDLFLQHVIRQMKEFVSWNRTSKKSPYLSVSTFLRICFQTADASQEISKECFVHLFDHLFERLKEEKTKYQQVVQLHSASLFHNCDMFYKYSSTSSHPANEEGKKNEEDENLFRFADKILLTPSGLYCTSRFWFYQSFQHPDYFDSIEQIACIRHIFQSITYILSSVFPDHTKDWPLQMSHPHLFAQELSSVPSLPLEDSTFLKDFQKQFALPDSDGGVFGSVHFLPVEVILGRLASFFQKSNVSHLSIAKQNQVLLHLFALHMEHIQNSLFQSSTLLPSLSAPVPAPAEQKEEGKEKVKQTPEKKKEKEETIKKLQSTLFSALLSRIYPGPPQNINTQRKTSCALAAKAILTEITTNEAFTSLFQGKSIEDIQEEFKKHLFNHKCVDDMSKLVHQEMSASDFLKKLLLEPQQDCISMEA